jgi:hypothetical protein
MSTPNDTYARAQADKVDSGSPKYLNLGASTDRPWVLLTYPLPCSPVSQ